MAFLSPTSLELGTAAEKGPPNITSSEAEIGAEIKLSPMKIKKLVDVISGELRGRYGC